MAAGLDATVDHRAAATGMPVEMLVAPVAMGSAPDLQLVTDAARSPVICTVRSFCDGRTRAKLFGVVLFQDRGSPQ